MPIYEYACSACGHRTDILHGVHDEGPAFCPSCGAEGTMRKAFAPPAIVFKGTGWAKKERRSSSSGGTSKSGAGSGSGRDGSDGATTSGASSDGSASGGSGSGAASSGSGGGDATTSSGSD